MPGATVTRVLIVSDTHGSLDPRIEALASDCDFAVHAGDVGGRDVAARLARRTRLVAVRGNNDVSDKWDVSEWAYLQTLPEQAHVELPGGLLTIVHGHRCGPVRTRHAWLRRHFPDARAIVYGHSHRLDCDLAIRPWVLNPGAAGRVRTYGGPSFVMLRARASGWSVKAVRLEPAEREAWRTRRRGVARTGAASSVNRRGQP